MTRTIAMPVLTGIASVAIATLGDPLLGITIGIYGLTMGVLSLHVPLRGDSDV